MANQLEGLIAKMREDCIAKDVQQFHAHYLAYKLARVEYRLRMKADNVPLWQVQDQLDKYYLMIQPMLKQMDKK